MARCEFIIKIFSFFLYLVTKMHQIRFDDHNWKLQSAKEKVKWHSLMNLLIELLAGIHLGLRCWVVIELAFSNDTYCFISNSCM